MRLAGDRVFSLERGGGQKQLSLVVRPVDEPAAAARLLVDPAALSADAATAIDWYHPSPDGRLVAYGVSEAGDERSVLRVLDVETRKHLSDEIPETRAASVAWAPDGTAFLYSRYPVGDQYNRRIYRHRLGEPWADDELVWAELPTPESWADVATSPDGRFALVTVLVGWSRTDLHLRDEPSGAVADAHRGRRCDHLRPLRRAAAGRPSRRSTRPAAGWSPCPSTASCRTRSGRPSCPRVRASSSTPSRSPAVCWSSPPTRPPPASPATRPTAPWSARSPCRSSARWSGSMPGPTERWPSCSSRASPVQPASSAGAGGELEPHGEHDHDDVLEAQFAVTQERYPSADGTEIGLFLVHRADEPPDVDTPCILTGYGGFAIAETPAWSPTIAAWAEAGGLFAVAGLRGGYEEGEAWHQAGRREHKQRVFDDFHAAADYLVTSQRTSRDRLAIRGGSNGGLLVGAAMTQRPDLCRAVHCAVPLLDMVRYPQFLIARLWTDEYGDPDVAEELDWLLAYSPYHHVKDGACYPAVLMTTAEGDSRVDPLHARKMAAALQAASSCPHDHPILLQQEARAGHGQGKPLHKQADELADVLSFFTWQLGVEAGT